MGSKPIPGYSNIFMAKKIDRIINMLADKNENALLLFKRFLDGLFFIFNGNSKQLHILFEDINKIHPAIKFTMEHTTNNEDTSTEKCDCKAKEYISFLDTSCRIIDGQIETDLHRKSTDRNQCLLPTSRHPNHTTASIPFSLYLRIVRNCSNITQVRPPASRHYQYSSQALEGYEKSRPISITSFSTAPFNRIQKTKESKRIFDPS